MPCMSGSACLAFMHPVSGQFGQCSQTRERATCTPSVHLPATSDTFFCGVRTCLSLASCATPCQQARPLDASLSPQCTRGKRRTSQQRFRTLPPTLAPPSCLPQPAGASHTNSLTFDFRDWVSLYICVSDLWIDAYSTRVCASSHRRKLATQSTWDTSAKTIY